MSTGARRTVTAINVVTMLAASPAYASSQSARQVIPIPPGEEARAGEIVNLFGMAPLAAPSAKVETRVPAHAVAPVMKPAIAIAKKPPALSGGHHDPGLLRRKAFRWFVITVVLLVGGLGMFLIAIPLDSGCAANTQPSSLTTGIEVVGLFAWMLSPAALVMCIVQWVRSRHAAHLPKATMGIEPTPGSM